MFYGKGGGFQKKRNAVGSFFETMTRQDKVQSKFFSCSVLWRHFRHAKKRSEKGIES